MTKYDRVIIESEGPPHCALASRSAILQSMKPKAAITATLSVLLLLFLASACGDGEENPFNMDSQVLTTADRPIAMAFAPDGRLFYAEQLTGNIRVISPEGELHDEPFAHVDAFEAGTFLEWGVTALALDPDFDTKHYVYVYFTELADQDPPVEVRPVVVRFTERENVGVQPKVLIGDLPATSSFYNVTGSLNVGPDGFLYVSVGDYDRPELAKDLSTAQGKMLRVNKETGAAAPDNPFIDQPDADPRIFAYGFREDFDFAFHPESGRLYGSDRTPVSCEELNLIGMGAYYGWPAGEFPFADCQTDEGTKAIHFVNREDMQPGEFLNYVSISALDFASGDVYPLVGDSLLVCESETNYMRRLLLSGTDLDQVTDDDVVVKDCDMDIAISPDGLVYYSNETEIRRLIPISE